METKTLVKATVVVYVTVQACKTVDIILSEVLRKFVPSANPK